MKTILFTKKIFQIIAFLLLALFFSLFLFDAFSHKTITDLISGILNFSRSPIATVFIYLFTFIIYFIGWLIIIFPIRSRSELPTFKEEMKAMEGNTLKEKFSNSLKKERVKLNQEKVSDKKSYNFKMGIAGLIIFFISGFAFFLFYYINKTIHVKVLLITAVALILSLFYFIRFFVSRNKS